MRELEEKESGLDRLAQADAVRDEDTRGAIAEHGQCRLELKGKETDRRPGGGVERPERVQLEERAIELVQPPARPHRARQGIGD